ncbi:MAG: fatty acyl-AMP ligase [Phenylobacterium sp.]
MTVQSEVTSLAELLWTRARLEPDRIAFRELRNDLGERDRVTYAQLHRRALEVGERLAGCARPGDRALLITPHAIDYLAGLFGCFYAGVVAVSGVPAYAPSTRSLRRTARLRRLHSVIADSGARVLIGPRDLLARIDDGLAANRGARPACLALDDLAGAPSAWRPLASDRETMAVLQYTSGSTTSPGGVVLRHGNLLSNLAAQKTRHGATADDVGVSWLPLHHDLGLIGGCLLPLYTGFPSVLLPAAGFLEQPRRWLQCLSTFGGTISWAPNFAYKLCLRSIPPDERRSLDLSRWRIAVNAAEPVQAETVREFAQAFAAAGFNPTTMYPLYGLAEATLVVSAPEPGSDVQVVRVDKAALGEDRVVVRANDDGGPGAVELVGCGHPLPGVDVVIADPRTLARSAAARVGEIWVSGPSRSEGYFTGGRGGREAPDGRLPGDPATYLRTGDLGFVLDGDLFITGRLKDVIILRGANIYPQDLETTAAASHPALREDCACAFPAVVSGEEAIVIVCEIDRRRAGDAVEAAGAIRRAVFQDHGLETYAVVIIPVTTMPKTPSGKVQRKACAQAWRTETLPVLHESRMASSSSAAAPSSASSLPSRTPEEIFAWIAQRLSQFAPDAEIDARSSLSELGLSSVQVTELAGDIQGRFGSRIPAADLFECRRISHIVERLVQSEAAVCDIGSRKSGS